MTVSELFGVDPQRLVVELPNLVRARQAPDDLISDCLRALVRIGFSSARFYERDVDPDRGAIYVLTHQLPTPNARLHGYTIPENETALHLLGDGRNVVLSDHSLLPSSAAWVDDLAMHGRMSLDIPVVSGGEILGLIAADCEVGAVSNHANAIGLFFALGAIAGSTFQASDGDQSREARLREVTSTEVSPEKFAEAAAKHLMQVSGAAHGALFRLDWRRQELVKIREWHGSLLISPSVLDEKYRVGQGLTGEAWHSREWRYVPDLAALVQDHPDLVNQDSYDYHARILSRAVKTVLYGKIGRAEPKYLVRVFNRARDPQLPFLGKRREFDRLAELYSVAFDDLVARRRLAHVASTARASVKNLMEPLRVVEAGVPGLVDEDVRDFIFVCRIEGSNMPIFAFASGQYREFRTELADISLPPRRTIRETFAEPGRIHTLEQIDRIMPAVARFLRNSRGASSVSQQFSCFEATSGEVTSLLVARTTPDVRKRAKNQMLPPEALQAVQVLVSLFAEAVDSKSSYLSARGARHALGYIGHELGTPLSILGDAAVAAVLGTLSEINAAGEFSSARIALMRTRLRTLYSRVQDSRGAANSALRLAPLVVQVGEGVLPMYVEPVRLVEIVDAATRQVALENPGGQRRGDDSRFRIELHESVKDLGAVNCDQFLTRQIMVNLIANGVKYSEVRRKGEDMVISVSGQRVGQNEISLSVQSWGSKISSENASAIFEAFVRGEMEQRLDAIRGMGLGLYLSRLIAIAHSGSLDLRRDSIVGSDLPQAAKGLVTFDLRLRRTLATGPQRFKWSDGQGAVEEGY